MTFIMSTLAMRRLSAFCKKITAMNDKTVENTAFLRMLFKRNKAVVSILIIE